MVCFLFVFEDETNLKINLWEYYVNIPPLLLFKLVWTGPTWSNLAPWIIPSICCRAASKSFEASEAEGDKLAMTFWMWATGANIKKNRQIEADCRETLKVHRRLALLLLALHSGNFNLYIVWLLKIWIKKLVKPQY